VDGPSIVSDGRWGPTPLSLGRLAELGPLGPAPAHSRYSFHDGLNFRYRGGELPPSSRERGTSEDMPQGARNGRVALLRPASA